MSKGENQAAYKIVESRMAARAFAVVMMELGCVAVLSSLSGEA